MNQAINKLVESQSGMRLRFSEESGSTVQTVVSFIEEQFPSISFKDQDEFNQFAAKYALIPFNLVNHPLYRFTIFDVEDRSGILLCANHLISDAWSFSIMAKSVCAFYEKLCRSCTAEVQGGDYRTFIEAEQKYLNSARYQKDKVYWSELYRSHPEISYIKPNCASVVIPASRRYTTQVTSTLSAKIDRFSQNTGISHAVLFETAVIAYLSRINSENKNISIGVPVLNRATATEKQAVGMFISTTPLTVSVSDEDSMESLCLQVTAQQFSLFRHQRYPYSHILHDLHERYNFTGNLYDVVVSFQNAQTNANTQTQWLSNGYCEVGLEFHIDNRDHADHYTLNIDYQTELFRQETEIDLLINRILFIIEQIIQNPAIPLKQLNILTEAEQKMVISDFNETAVSFPKETCVHELFQEQVKKTPDSIALIACDKTLSYKELNERANQIAHSLIKKGISPGDIVAIALSRKSNLIAGILGILKIGAAYTPIDPDYPQQRVEYMLQDSGAKLLITDQNIEELLDNSKYNNPEISFSSECICYALFTSGTTGNPKAAMIKHRNLVNFCNNNHNNYQCALVNSCSAVLAVTTLTFDISVFEIFMTLLNGLTLVLADENAVTSPERMANLISSYHIEALHSTPTKFTMYLENRAFQAAAAHLKVLMIGAEVFTHELFSRIREFTNAAVYNGYGPTETTIGVTFKHLSPTEDITIGKPIANTKLYIVDKDMKSLPIGIAGELCIAGDCVGGGYLNRPDLTAEKFINNPFGTKKLYKTGDLARWRVDGEIEYLGRIDTQIKIRGLRIELGEIESAMASFEGIQLVAVTDKRDEQGRQYLVGYYTAPEQINEKSLRQSLAAKLPKYMIPNYFVHLNEMPMTTSGKTDRKNLPIPDFSKHVPVFSAPDSPTEKKIADIWKELLKLEQISKHDDFFEIGGDSLVAIHLLSKLEDTFDAVITVKDIMEHSALDELAIFIEHAETTVDKIVHVGKTQYTLLPQQLAIYAVCQKQPDTLAYNMPARIKLPTTVNHKKLCSCIKKLPNLHPELRTCIKQFDGTPYAIFDSTAELNVETINSENTFVRPFDLTAAPLVRIALFENTLLFDMHHIISDGASLSIILNDLEMLYNDQEVSPSSVTYADYADYFRNINFFEHTNFFKKSLTCNFEPVILPEKKCSNINKGVSKFFQMDKRTFDYGKRIAKTYNLTDTMVFLGAFGILLSKYTGRQDILSSVVLTNRTHKEISNTMGMFVNTLPILLNTQGTVSEYLSSVRELIMNLFKYQEMPFLYIAEEIGMHDKTVVNTSFVYQADGAKLLTIGAKTSETEFIATNTAKFDLTFDLTPNEKGCSVRIEYNCGKYKEQLINDLYKSYIQIIDQLASERIADICVLSPEEYQRIVYSFNNTAVSFPKEKCIHELFQEQVKKSPEQVAVVFETQAFTYRQIDEMSNSLAHNLKKKGVGPGDIIPIIAKRSHLILVAMFAVLKAGAAYMPVDPTYPKDRMDYMFEDSQAKLALTLGYNGVLDLESINLEQIDFENDTSPLENTNTPEDLCYIIFTSGSTGRPKGVMLPHRAVVNYSNNNHCNMVCSIISPKCHSIVSVTNIVFDIFVTESILPLLNGLTVYLASENQCFRQDALAKLIQQNHIDVIQTTPTKMRSYLLDKENLSYLNSLKVIIMGGEVFSVDLYKELNTKTDAEIFNIYGPAETTVWSTNAQIKSTNITIGRPVANTQIYILDNSQHPLPIGVAGELYISGEGVGKGYLNRPDLTAERFLPNPFLPGTFMYRTGDLARWTDDGEIEYLGRIDTQVKIRGLRIELGEIESVMAAFEGIQLVAVTDKRDNQGHQYLVGYYTAPEQINERALRQSLASKLPKYMVPNYFIHLDEMPMTASGKTDRKNLPAPVFSIARQEYIAPETIQESALCSVLEELFQLEQIGVTDDFFDLGGDSLRAIEYMTKAHNKGITFTLQNIFDHPTVRELCVFIAGSDKEKVQYKKSDFEKYQSLLKTNIINNDFVPVKNSMGNVFLTGATGFLGSHILDQFMKSETGKIYCLVRGGQIRLSSTLQYYFGDDYTNELGNRIIVIDGDITKEQLSDFLPNDIHTVIHAAATVKHFGTYDYFYKVNVLGTKHVISYAKHMNAKLIHISTLSVSGNSLVDAFDIYRSEKAIEFNETSLYIEQPLDNVYIHSKFEAECAVLDAALTGLDVKIIRVGNLTNRASDYKFQPNYQSNAFLTRVKAGLEIGCFPDYMLPLYSEFSPIDQTADGIIKIAQYASNQTVFHLNSNQNLYFTRMVEIVNSLEIKMEILSGPEFNAMLQKLSKDEKTAYIYEAFQNDIDQSGQLVYDTNIQIKNDFTIWFLEKLGFRWAQIDQDYIEGYITYFRNLGYLSV